MEGPHQRDKKALYILHPGVSKLEGARKRQCVCVYDRGAGGWRGREKDGGILSVLKRGISCYFFPLSSCSQVSCSGPLSESYLLCNMRIVGTLLTPFHAVA